MNGLELYLQALAGGITGYVTNVTAVKMLFKKVFGFGGVIIETREEFIENVSKLVERDIINHGTLDNELSKDAFIAKVTKVVDDILQRQLYEVTPNIKLGQVPQMTESMDNFINFLSEKQPGVIDKALKTVMKTVALQDILSKKQVEVLATQGIDASLHIFTETKILDDFISSLHLQYKDDTLADIIPPKVFEIVTQNLHETSADLHRRLQQDYDTMVSQLMDDLYVHFDISTLVVEIQKSIKNKTLIELLGRTHAKNISNELLEHIVKFLQSAEGRKVLAQASEYLFRVIKEVDMPLFNLFKPQLADDLEKFLASKLPGVIQQLIVWFKQNQDQIESKIEEALQSTLAQETGARAEMKKFLYTVLTKQALAGKFQVVAKVIKGIETNVDVRILSEEITADIIGYLKRTNISEMVGSLEDKGIFTSHDITRLIEGNLKMVLARIDLNPADSYFNTKLGDIFTISLAQPMESYIKGLLTKVKEDALYSQKFTETFQKQLTGMIREMSTKTLGNLVQDESGRLDVSKIKSHILIELQTRRDELVTAVVGHSSKMMGDKKIRDVLNTNLEDQAARVISKKISLYTTDKLQELQLRPLHHFYDRYNAVQVIGTKLTRASMDLLNHNLENITKGQIEAVVATNLSKLSNEQLQEMVEDFMGKELKPISWLGALIGAFAGLGFGFAKSMMQITGSWSIALAVPVYGFVGYITNKQALWMIFHPYHPWRIFSRDVPLTQGVIVKSKPRFAKSMARFVGEELLTPQSSIALFEKNRESLYHAFRESIAKDNYKKVENILVSNIVGIASGLLMGGVAQAEKHYEQWSRDLVDKIQHIRVKKLGLGHLIEILREDGVDLLAKMQPAMGANIYRTLNVEKTLIEVLPTQVTQSLKSGLNNYVDNQFAQLQELLQNKELLDQTLTPILAQPYQHLVAQNLNQLLGDQKKEQAKKKITDLIFEQLQTESGRQKIHDSIQEKFTNQLDPDKKIRDLFDGKVIQVIEEHLDPILGILTEKANIFLDHERESFKNAAKKEAREAKGNLYFRVANSLLDLDSTIDHVVDHLVDKTTPEIMIQSRKDLETLVLDAINKIGDSSMEEIGIHVTEQGITDIVSSLLDNQAMHKHLRVLSGGLLESFADVPLARLLRVAGITQVDHALDILAVELNLVHNSVHDCLVTKEEKIKTAISKAAEAVFEDLVLGLSVRSVFKRVDLEHIDQAVSETFARIKQTGAFRLGLQEFTERLMDYAKDKELGQIIDPILLKKDLGTVICSLLNDKKMKSELQATLEEALRTLFLNINDIVEKETKDFGASMVVESILNSLEKYIPDLVTTLDMGSVTERQINNMEPKDIEDLFNSFGSPYFRKLELYGLWGGLLGLTLELLLRNTNLPLRF